MIFFSWIDMKQFSSSTLPPQQSCRFCDEFDTFWIFNMFMYVHMFIFNPMIPVANTKLGIEFEHANMLKIQNVWNLSDNFEFILPQQIPVSVLTHAQNFLNWSSEEEKNVAGKCKLLSPKDSYRGD